MPRYLVEREFPDGLRIPIDETGARTCLAVMDGNSSDQVTWVHSYVSADEKKAFCIYSAPTPEAIRRTAARYKLPVAAITEVRVLDHPVFLHMTGVRTGEVSNEYFEFVAMGMGPVDVAARGRSEHGAGAGCDGRWCRKLSAYK